jgi:scyllo-inositol 2-dehydrogenase (NADP+)
MNELPVNTALMSYGMSGEVFHAPLLSALPSFKLSTVLQRRSDTVRQHFPTVRVARSAEEIFGDKEIELRR